MITVIGSLKGGTGKSTVAFNLALWLLRSGMPLRVIDLDPQATLRDVGAVRGEQGHRPELAVENGASLGEGLRDFQGEVLIDVGVADFGVMRRAIQMADRIVVPVAPSQADVWSTQTFVQVVERACNGGRRPEIVCFLNRADVDEAVEETHEAAAALLALDGIRFVRRRLGQRLGFRRSFSEGLAVFELEPRGVAAGELTALAGALYPEALS